MNTKKRIYQIDLFRFLAALAVVFYHYLFRGYNADNMSDLNFNEISGLFKYGYLGVNFFFIISGFVILLSIKHNSLVKFIISRISRLYPIYWISILLTFIVIILFGFPRYTADFKQLLVNLTMFQNYLGVKNIDGAYWSLFVEMKFYIFIIGSYLILHRKTKIKLDYLIYFWLFLSVIYIPLSNLAITKFVNYILILNWSSYFIAGILFYQIFNDRLKLKYWIPLCICLCLSLYHSMETIDILEQKYNSHHFSPFIVSSIVILFYALMLLVATNNLKKLNSPKLMKIGVLTYPLYLLHQNIGFIIFNNLGIYINKYILLGSTVLFMLGISYILSEKYEPKVGSFLKRKLERLTRKIS